MTQFLRLVFIPLFAAASVFATPATASDAPILSTDVEDLSEFKWKKRLVVVFAESTDDPAFIEQMKLLQARLDDLEERDVLIVTDTSPDARRALRLKMRPRGFMLVLVGKDGNIKLRKPFPWSVREITRSIDKMPIRQREIREQNTAPRGR